MRPHVREAAQRFHEENPHVYAKLRDIALQVKAKGRAHFGIAFIFERLRWLSAMETHGDPYKLNNNHRAFYARLLMDSDAELAGLFTTRTEAHDPDYGARFGPDWQPPF